MIKAFDDLVKWVRQGTRPEGDEVYGDLRNAGMKFTDPLRPNDPGGVTIKPVATQQVSKVDFVRDVQPIFRQSCYGCHGPALQQNGFRIDRRSDAMRGGTITVIGPGASEASRMYLRLIGSDYGTQMPPTGALSPDKIRVIKDWIDQGAEWPDDVSGETPPPPADPTATSLIDAIRRGDRKAFKTIVAATPKAGGLRGSAGTTPLMYAVLYSDAASVQTLLDGGADVNARNDAGATALMWAVTDLEKTRLLIDHGADVNAKSGDQRTPLLIAAGIAGASPVVKLLIEHGAKVSVKAPGLDGETSPLVEATLSGDEPTFRLLMANGADVNATGPGPLLLALRAQCVACVDTLLKATNPAFLTPAMIYSSPPIGTALATPMLLDRGADAKAKDPAGRTMLMLAASSDAIPVEAIKVLAARGADVNAKGPNGETALTFARLRGRTAVVDELIKAGAVESSPAPVATALKPSPASSPRAAVERVLPLLQQNDVTFLKKSGCVSCHNNSLTAMTVALARGNGLRVDEDVAHAQAQAIGRYIDSWRERALQGVGIPGDTDTVSYILLGLSAENYPPDQATDAMARFIKRQQRPTGEWLIFAHRPPLESNDIQLTATSIRALQVYAPRLQRIEYEKAINRATAWLVKADARTTEERAFQLMGLGWAAAQKAVIQKAARALTAEQRSDGGWSQLPTTESDAYATGQALVALKQSGAVDVSDAAYKRGVQFLLNSQLADGSWYVKSRALPIQPHFESGFPHGRDQFISAAASNWGAMALALAVRSGL